MPPPELLVPFFLATAVFAFVPGSGMLYAAGQTLALGRRAGWWSALGFHIAGLGHIAVAAFGVPTLLAIMPVLFVAVKLAGATYLIWVGVRYIRSPPLAVSAAHPGTEQKALCDSIVVEVLNPKSALFFLAFLPQFTDASAALPIWLQIVALGLIVNTVFTISDVILVEALHAMTRRLRESARFILFLQRFGGGLLVALGVKLALAKPQ